MFPAEYVQEFQNCFDRAPSVPFQEIQAILREELGRPIDSVYEYVDPTPVASASIAQVNTLLPFPVSHLFCVFPWSALSLSYFHFLLVFLTCSKFEYNAQVHAARLKGSQDDVVIKVLKPGIKDILVADLNFVYIVARILEFLNPELSRASLV